MDQEQAKRPTCVLCGTEKGSYKFYHDAKDKNLYLCVDCLRSATRSLSRDQLSGMTVEQLRQHMEVRDELASVYRDSFVATKTFCIGKKRTIPILEVDEERGLWALPKAPMPLALPISSIVDVELTLTAEDPSESGELVDELLEEWELKDVLPFLGSLISSRYRSRHLDLAPIPEGKWVTYLNMVLTLDDQEAGMNRVEIDLLPFWICLPSRVNAAYDCAYDVIEFLRQRARSAYAKRQGTREVSYLTRNDQLGMLASQGLMTRKDAEVLSYYLERMSGQDATDAIGSRYGLVKSVVDSVSAHLLYGEKVPDWKTQHTTSIEAFLGAFHRYAPGLSVWDVVYIMDNTSLQSGKGGMLFAEDSFAVDDFSLGLDEPAQPSQPVSYDDLLLVATGEDTGRLVLVYRDGRRVEVNGGPYSHFIFAAVNCILLLGPHERR